MKFKVGDIVRIFHPHPDLHSSFHYKVGKIKSIREDWKRNKIQIEFINLKFSGTLGLNNEELEKLSDVEAFAYMI